MRLFGKELGREHNKIHTRCPLTFQTNRAEEAMDALHSPPPTTATAASTGEESMLSRVKKSCLSFTVSLQEGFGYVKAFFVGQAKRITARNEKEATAADLLTAKMQVEAADAAQESKKRIQSSS